MPDQPTPDESTKPSAKTNGPSRPRSRTWLRNLAFAVVAVILFFVLAELIIRLTGFDSWQVDFAVYRNVPGDITPNQRVDYRFLNFDHRCAITINRLGFREPTRLRDRPFRVLCLGDSSTLGFGVNDHETYPAQLQRYLDGHYDGLFDVINAGVVGYTIDDELEYLLEKGFTLEPSVVVLEVFWNDVLEKSIRPKSSQRAHSKKLLPYTPLASATMKSALYQAWRNKILRWEVQRGDFPELPIDKLHIAMEPAQHSDFWKPWDEQFLRLADACRQRAIPLIVVITPHQYQIYDWNFPAWDYANADAFQSHVAQLAAQAGAPVVDLLPVYKSEAQSYRALYLSEGLYDEHVGPIGQWIKAREIQRALADGPMKGAFHNLYNMTLTDEFVLLEGVRRGRLWRPQNDNGGLFFKRGGMAAIPMTRPGRSAMDYVFASGLAVIGESQSGVTAIFYDADLRRDAGGTSPTLRVLAEYAPISFPTSTEIQTTSTPLPDVKGNTLLLVIEEPLAIQGLRQIEEKANHLLLKSPIRKATSADATLDESQEAHEYFYFLRQPLIYPQSNVLPGAEAPPSPQP